MVQITQKTVLDCKHCRNTAILQYYDLLGNNAKKPQTKEMTIRKYNRQLLIM